MAVAIAMIAAVAATGGRMEIRRTTSQTIETKILEGSETLIPGSSANSTDASEIATGINNRTALHKKLGDVAALARNNDASDINELLEGNQTLGTKLKKPAHPSQVFQDKFEIKQTESKIEKEREAAIVNFVSSAVGAAASFGMGAGGAGASAGAAASAGEAPEQSKRVESEVKKSQSELELFRAKVHKLLA
jgi:hypothetical protein